MNSEKNDFTSVMAEDVTLDLLEIVGLLWRKLWLLILGFVIGAVAAFAVTEFLITPLYKATSVIYIFSKTTSITSLTDLQIGSQLTADFQIVATTRDVVEGVIDSLSLDADYETLVKQISVTNPADSHMLEVTVTDPDPERAAKICNALSDTLREQIADIMNTDRPSMVQRAVIPTQKASPSLKKNTATGAFVGTMIVIALLLARYMLDDTIKTKEDVEKYLGVDVLAAFPLVKDKNWKNEKGR